MDLDELERLANAATQGRWVASVKHQMVAWESEETVQVRDDLILPKRRKRICLTDNDAYCTPEEVEANTRFIAAANPLAVKALIARIRELEANEGSPLTVGEPT